MNGRWRTISVLIIITCALGACTNSEPSGPSQPTGETPADPPVGPPSSTEALPIIEVGGAFPASVVMPKLAYPDDPEAAEVLTDPLPAPTTEGLGIYPIFLQTETDYHVGFIDADGVTIHEPTYTSHELCLGSDGEATGMVAWTLESTDLLDPETGTVRWSSPNLLHCVAGAPYLFDANRLFSLVSGDLVYEAEAEEFGNFLWIDSHTVDVTTATGSGTVVDLETDLRIPHEGRVVERVPSAILPVEFSRKSTFPVEGPDGSTFRYMSWDGTFSQKIEGFVDRWYNETVALVVRMGTAPGSLLGSVYLMTLEERSGTAVIGDQPAVRHQDNDLIWVCARWDDAEGCLKAGIATPDGAWVVDPGDGDIYILSVEGGGNAAARTAVFDTQGPVELIDLPSGEKHPIPRVEGVRVFRDYGESGCPSFETQGKVGDSPSGVIRPDGSVVALPTGYQASGSLRTNGSREDRGCEIIYTTIAEGLGDSEHDLGPQAFTSDGRRLPESISVTFSVGPHLNWVRWGDHAGYLDTTTGNWLYRM